MTKFVVALSIVALLAMVGLLATSDSAYIDSHADQDQFVSSLLK